MSSRVLIHCNAGHDYGMGHLMRSLALAAEAEVHGWSVFLAGDLNTRAVQLATKLAPRAELSRTGPDVGPALSRIADQYRPNILHLDTYWLRESDLPHGTHLISNMQDGQFGRRRADITIDANLGAEHWQTEHRSGTARLLGIDAAVVRRQVLEARDARRARTRSIGHRRVLVVLGGTDATNLTGRVLDALVRLKTPLVLTVIGSANLGATADGTHHEISLRPFVEDLPALAATQDLVISAAGTSVWDFACIGVPMALVCAVDNQRAGYESAIDAEIAAPLGFSNDGKVSGISDLNRIVQDEAWLVAAEERLRATVDGLGAWRIVSSWKQVLRIPPRIRPTSRLSSRRAKLADAELLFQWRNDEATRTSSRSGNPLEWGEHIDWLERSLNDASRQLYLIEEDATALGTVRWDRVASGWEASITVAPGARGKGLGSKILDAGEKSLVADAPSRLVATIHNKNLASRGLFARAGYLPLYPADSCGFAKYARWR